MIRSTAVSRLVPSLAAALALSAGLAAAQGAPDPADAAVKARQSHMQLFSFNLGLLGGMAQENIPYDAAAATAAAANLVALAGIDQGRYWMPGTDSDSREDSRTLPALWQNIPDAVAKNAALGEAAMAMQAAAAVDLASLRGAMGPLGGACSACHEAYRKPR